MKTIPYYQDLTGKGSTTEILLYGLIEVLSFKDGHCFASNQALGEMLGISKGTAANALSVISKKGWVRIETDGDNHRTAIIPQLEIGTPSRKNEAPLHKIVNPPLHKIVNIDNKSRDNKVDNLMSAPAKPAPTRELPNEAKELAHLLHYLILQNKPDRRIQDGWTDRWAEDIEKAHRIDGRGWEQLKAAIIWSQRDEFWKQNILSGEKLRKHYDRMSDRARAEREKNASQDVASAIFSQTNEQAVENAKKLGLIP